MKRRFLLSLFVFVFLFAVACGNDDTNVGTNNDQDIIQEDDKEEDIQDEETDNESGEEQEEEEEQLPDDVFNDETGEEEEEEGVFSHIYTIEIMDTTMYAIKDVNVRSLPSTEGEIVGRLVVNDSVHVVGRCVENGWYKVEYNEQYAFVHYDYLGGSKVTVLNNSYSWIASLDVAKTTDQIIIVSATDTYANVGMYIKKGDGI